MKIIWSHNWFLEYRIAVFREMQLKFSDFHVIFASNNLSKSVLQDLENEIINLHDLVSDFDIRINLPNSNSDFANKSFGIKFPIGLFSKLHRLKPDILIGEGFFRWGLIHLLAKKIIGYKYVMCYERTPHTERNVPRFVNWLRKLALSRVDYLIVNGIETEKYVRTLGWKKNILRVHMVPETKYFKKLLPTTLKKTSIKYLYIGKLVERKGIDKLVSVWKKFNESSSSEMYLDIIGTGPLSKNLVKHPNIKYHGKIDFSKLSLFFKKNNYLIMPTLEDNWSMVVPESLSASTPVISTFENGNSVELLQRKGMECGFVYNATNTDELLDTLIKSSKINKTEYSKMTNNCKKIDNEYNVDRVIKNFKQICGN
tara:strand:+ start:206 stop:1315 length:1110 start_codon:yes stop_codon:yes gene_type:complete